MKTQNSINKLSYLILFALVGTTSLSAALATDDPWQPCGPDDRLFTRTVDGGMVSKKADVVKGTRVSSGSWVCAGSVISGDPGSVIISGFSVIKDTTIDASKDAVHTDAKGQVKKLDKNSTIQIGCDNSDLSQEKFTAVIGAKITGDVKINCAKITSANRIPTLDELERTTPVAKRNGQYAINISATQKRNKKLTIEDSEMSLEESGYPQINIDSTGEIINSKITGNLTVIQRNDVSPNYILNQKLAPSTQLLMGGHAPGNRAIGEEDSWMPSYLQEKPAERAAQVVRPTPQVQTGYRSNEVIQPIPDRSPYQASPAPAYRASGPAR